MPFFLNGQIGIGAGVESFQETYERVSCDQIWKVHHRFRLVPTFSLVVECMGWAKSGRQITRFLVLEKSWVDRSDNLVVSLWSNIWPWGLSRALDSEWYLPREGDGNNLPLPHFSKPLPGRSSSAFENTVDGLGCNSLLPFLLY